jgi:hypothetical protein
VTAAPCAQWLLFGKKWIKSQNFDTLALFYKNFLRP